MVEVAEVEFLTLGEIEKRFDGEWVLVTEPELDARLHIVRGVVAFHATDRETVERAAISMHLRRSAIFFVGESLSDDEMLFAL